MLALTEEEYMDEITLFEVAPTFDVREKRNAKRRWENAFQKWSDEQSQDETTPNGKCGYGSVCDWCGDNSYGRPCVRALNEMCRERGIKIDYADRDFEQIWFCADGERKDGDRK